MAKRHPGAECDQTRGFRRPHRFRGRAPSRSAARHNSVGSPVGSAAASQEQPLALGGQTLDSLAETLLDPARQRQRGRQGEAARQVRRRQSARQLEQCERIPTRLGDESLAHALVQRHTHHRGEQFARVGVRQPFEPQLRQPRQLIELARLALREHEARSTLPQPPGDERKHLCRRLIEPLRIIDQAQKRLLFGSVGEQAQQGQADEKRSGRAPELTPKAVPSASR